MQGALGGIATWILGLPSPLIWSVMFGFCSFVPVFGTALAWIPASLWLLALGDKGKAAVMVAVSILIITQVDNVIRPLLVSGRSRLNFELSMLAFSGSVTATGMLAELNPGAGRCRGPDRVNGCVPGQQRGGVFRFNG